MSWKKFYQKNNSYFCHKKYQLIQKQRHIIFDIHGFILNLGLIKEIYYNFQAST